MPPTTAVIANTLREAMRLAPEGSLYIRPGSGVLGLRIDHLIVAFNVDTDTNWFREEMRSRLAPNATVVFADDHRTAGTDAQ